MMRNQSDTHNLNPADRPAELDELNFNDDEATRDWGDEQRDTLTAEDLDVPQSYNLDQESTDDDLTPETLIPEDGARSPRERDASDNAPADETFSIVNDDEIGAGQGLDEAELAEIDPVNRDDVKE